MKNVDKTYNRIMCCVYIAGLIVTIVIILIIIQLCNNYNKVVITDSDNKSKNSILVFYNRQNKISHTKAITQAIIFFIYSTLSSAKILS